MCQFSIFKKIDKLNLRTLKPSVNLLDIDIPSYNIIGNDFSDGLKVL